MPVTRCIIEGKSILTMEDLYRTLGEQLSFPPHFGNNLDALWDTLANDIPGPVELVWLDAAISRNVLGDQFAPVAALLQEVNRERRDFRVIFR
jgi:ribonuclease inhibitor